jgi:hypothetical protein
LKFLNIFFKKLKFLKNIKKIYICFGLCDGDPTHCVMSVPKNSDQATASAKMPPSYSCAMIPWEYGMPLFQDNGQNKNSVVLELVIACLVLVLVAIY